MAKRLRVAVLFGGRPHEHVVSLMSAQNVVASLDPSKYEVVPIAVSRSGRWFSMELNDGTLPGKISEEGDEICLFPGGGGRALLVPHFGTPREIAPIDILFPVLHGLHGEDGTIQGAAEVAGVPLAGCALAGSACAIDKDIAKRLLREAGLPVAKSVTIRSGEKPSFEEIAEVLGTPVFVKPARQGSSVGVGRASSAEEFESALAEAFRCDRKVLAEEFIQGREIEFGILEKPDGSVLVSVPREIAPADTHRFYTYEAKYIDADGAHLSAPADLSPDVAEKLRGTARRAFRTLECDGMARVDFFVRPDMSFVVNEINTIPGFTDISMYARAFAASGIPYPEILDCLIEFGFSRAEQTV
ncbi:D-alanine--D-alanine ligase [Rhizobiales bacterium]|uniref:D-alanine--D-alanine ligase family protein n=1 Tax=Hongsoonwoonella zoysiae TaxID=2821844 RepID=UPI001560880C|nr:D-alanine--D-alanine ligase family protein [Hongsoonwoonella zoysiae]NRG19488.1 D-alanine--D-alanine ligase [Hongsoonwoonella zoysiae]